MLCVFAYRSWGVCFTYGAWFGLEAFACMGYSYNDKYVTELYKKTLQKSLLYSKSSN